MIITNERKICSSLGSVKHKNNNLNRSLLSTFIFCMLNWFESIKGLTYSYHSIKQYSKYKCMLLSSWFSCLTISTTEKPILIIFAPNQLFFNLSLTFCLCYLQINLQICFLKFVMSFISCNIRIHLIFLYLVLLLR